MKDVILLAVSLYLLKQDVARVSLAAARGREWQAIAGIRARTVEEVAAL